MTRIYFVFTCFLIIVCSCTAQSELPVTKEDPFYKVFSEQEYLADLDELANTLTETHPLPYKFTSKEDFWKTVAHQKSRVTDSTSLSDFIWYCSAIIANIGCSHTSLGYFNQEDRMLPVSLRFPMEAKIIDNRWYVSDPLVNTGNVMAGDEIFSINGVPVEEIKGNIYAHIAAQAKNTSYKRLLLNGFFTAYIPYALGFPENYQVVVKGKENPIALSQLSEYKYKPRIDPKAACQDRLCLNVLEGNDTAILTVRSFAFYGQEKMKIFKSFIDNSFEEILAKGVKNLVIDLRMNNGGSAYAGIHLLQYVMSEPFIYFAQEADGEDFKNTITPFADSYTGKTYVLIDGEGTSTTGHFLSLVKQKDSATLIGEEAGSNYVCTANQRRGVRLSNTGISFSVARNTYLTTAQDFPEDRGILPDHNVVQSIEDLLNHQDTVMNYTLALIKSK